MSVIVDFEPDLLAILINNKDLNVFKRHAYYDRSWLKYLEQPNDEKLQNFNKTPYGFYLNFKIRHAFINSQFEQEQLRQKKFDFFNMFETRTIPIWHGTAVTTNYDAITPWIIFHRAHHCLTIFNNTATADFYNPSLFYLNDCFTTLPWYKYNYEQLPLSNYQQVHIYHLLINTKSTRAGWSYIPVPVDCYADVFAGCVSQTFKIKTKDQIQQLVDFLNQTTKFIGVSNPFLQGSKKSQLIAKNNAYFGRTENLQRFVEFPDDLKRLLVDLCYFETELLLNRRFIINLILLTNCQWINGDFACERIFSHLYSIANLNYRHRDLVKEYAYGCYKQAPHVNNPTYVEINVDLFLQNILSEHIIDPSMLKVLKTQLRYYFQTCQQYNMIVEEFVEKVKTYRSQIGEL